MNPEDKDKIKIFDSYRDRISEIRINYILNYSEEVKNFRAKAIDRTRPAAILFAAE